MVWAQGYGWSTSCIYYGARWAFEDVGGAEMGTMKHFCLCIGHISGSSLPETLKQIGPQNVTFS